MKVFKTKTFARYARRESLSDGQLADAIRRAESGVIDALLGGGLIKQRVARPGAGRSGGCRTIVAYRRGSRCFFILGFAKNERDDVEPDELERLKRAAEQLMNLDIRQIEIAIENKQLFEVEYDA